MNLSPSDFLILAKTIYGEARGEIEEGKIAVACVVLNRARKRGQSVTRICLAPQQFSCWNRDDPNYRKILFMAGEQLQPYLDLLWDYFAEEVDITNGATHYRSTKIKPYWARGKKPCCQIGNHIFYNNVI